MVTAETDDGEIMGLRHRTLPVEGIQYHPESMLTSRINFAWASLDGKELVHVK